jgi:hypothetical protein
MIVSTLAETLHTLTELDMPLPGAGQTPLRLARFMDLGRQNLGLARLAEAHWDAVAILAEAGRKPRKDAAYGVWASEIPGQCVALTPVNGFFTMSGTKRFCSGAGIVDCALVTVAKPEPLLVEIDLRTVGDWIQFDESDWKTAAFIETHTATATFSSVPVCSTQIIGGRDWYINRLGFWLGACGPAACWAGGAEALVDYAMSQSRHDPHTLAHLGALYANRWALRSCLESAGREIDEKANTPEQSRILALSVRHLIEQFSSDVLRRLTRAYGPHPLVFDETVSRTYRELDLYLRQSHAERDLESLGQQVMDEHSTQR